MSGASAPASLPSGGGSASPPEGWRGVPAAVPEGLRGASAPVPEGWRGALVEALARRAQAQPGGALRDRLEARLAQARSALADQARTRAAEGAALAEALAQRHPAAAPTLATLGMAGDLPALRWLAAHLDAEARRRPLAEVCARLDAQASSPSEAVPSAAEQAGRSAIPQATRAAIPDRPAAQGAAPVPELKAWREHRDTWRRIGIEQQLRRAMAELPEQAGPLHSQRLVLRALQQMQATAPAYLAAFLAQAEALVALEDAIEARRPAAAPPRRGDGRARARPSA